MTALYWVLDDDGSLLFRWDGIAVSSVLIDPWEEMGNLVAGPGGEIVVSVWDTAGACAFTIAGDLDTATRMDWPAMVDEVTLTHHNLQGLGIYDASIDAYWMNFEPTTRSSSPVSPVWGKFDRATGGLLSLHVDDAAHPHFAAGANGGHPVLNGGWLYWTSRYNSSFSGTQTTTLHRFNTTTEEWQWCFAQPDGQALDAAYQRWLLGITQAGDLVMHWYDPDPVQDPEGTDTGVWIETYSLSALTWSDHTSSTASGLPAPVLIHDPDPDEVNGILAGSDGRTGTFVVANDVLYYPTYAYQDPGDGLRYIDVYGMDLLTGTLTEQFRLQVASTSVAAFGFAAVFALPSIAGELLDSRRRFEP